MTYKHDMDTICLNPATRPQPAHPHPATIPPCPTQQIVVSGLRLLSTEAASPRSRYIIAAGMAFGLGSALAISPELWAESEDTGDARGLLSATVRIIVTTPYCVGTLVALLVGMILPHQ